MSKSQMAKGFAVMGAILGLVWYVASLGENAPAFVIIGMFVVAALGGLVIALVLSVFVRLSVNVNIREAYGQPPKMDLSDPAELEKGFRESIHR